MREVTERVIVLDWEHSGAAWADRLEYEARKMAAEGWYYLECRPDQMLETVVLFFERDLPE
jgi:hypothetical protein